MKRRDFLFSAAAASAACVFPGVSAAQSEALPYREVRVSGDGLRTLVFFAFSCPECRRHHQALQEWSETLPRAMSFEFVPVVVADHDHMLAARAWYAAKLVAPTRMGQFAEAVYAQVHDLNNPISSPSTWIAAARAARLSDFTAAWAKVPVSAIELAANRLAQYAITETPSMAIGGRYVITPDNVNGDARLFIALANGLVSKQLQKAL